MANWQWAAAWKRAAKNYRQMFKLCACVSVPIWQRRYWAARRWARAWKAAAKKWRRRALEEEAAAGHERGEWLRIQQPVEYKLEVEDLPFADDIVKAFEDFEVQP